MRVKARLRTLATRALTESMEVKTMIHVARRIFGQYDLHDRTGFPQSVPIPNKTAAAQIVSDVADANLFLEFVSLLMSLERVGMAGRKYRIPRLSTIVADILDTGYRYDSESRSFVEDSAIRTTRNWGVLHEGETYIMAFLGIDVSGNSELVRVHGRDVMQDIYDVLRRIARDSVERRNGRLWGWEGDGGLCAFTFEEENQRAVHAAVEMLHELFLYNIAACPLPEGLHVRLTVHNGPCEYQSDGTELKVDAVKRLWEIDTAYGRSDSLVVSAAVMPSLDPALATRFEEIPTDSDGSLYVYSVGLR